VAKVAGEKVDLILEGSLSPTAQIKVLDTAYIEPDLLKVLVPILLSVVFSASVGLLAVYLLATYLRIPLSSGEVQEWMGAPVLVKLPKAFPSWWRRS
jgi:hypothetical protein